MGGDDDEDVILIHYAATCQRERRKMTIRIALRREERVTCQYRERKKGEVWAGKKRHNVGHRVSKEGVALQYDIEEK